MRCRGPRPRSARPARHRGRARPDGAEEVQVERALERGAALVRGHGPEERIGRRRRRPGRASRRAARRAPRGRRCRRSAPRPGATGPEHSMTATPLLAISTRAEPSRLVRSPARRERVGSWPTQSSAEASTAARPASVEAGSALSPSSSVSSGAGRAVDPRGDLRGLARAHERAREQSDRSARPCAGALRPPARARAAPRR